METQTIYFDDSYAHYAQAGEEGPTIILLHGWAASLKQWEWFLPILANAGYRAYALDLLGHGRASRLPHNHTIEDYLDYLCRWIKALNIQQPIFLGHSMGGYLSLRYVLDHPGTVHTLVLVDPLYDYHQFGNYHQFARQLLSGSEMQMLGEFLFRHVPIWLIQASHDWNPHDIGDAPARIRRQIALDYKQADPRIVHTILSIDDLRPCLTRVGVPTLVTWGCHDHLLSPDSFDTLVDLLPVAQGHCFTDAGHHPHLARSQSFTELVLGFLRQMTDDNAGTEVSHLWSPSTTAFPADR